MKNICTFTGVITRKNQSKKVVNLTLEVPSVALNSDAKPYDRIDYAQVVCWSDQAEAVAMLPLGAELKVEARMQTRGLIINGLKCSVTEFVALQILDTKENAAPASAAKKNRV
jgi:hypothetical protein